VSAEEIPSTMRLPLGPTRDGALRSTPRTSSGRGSRGRKRRRLGRIGATSSPSYVRATSGALPPLSSACPGAERLLREDFADAHAAHLPELSRESGPRKRPNDRWRPSPNRARRTADPRGAGADLQTLRRLCRAHLGAAGRIRNPPGRCGAGRTFRDVRTPQAAERTEARSESLCPAFAEQTELLRGIDPILGGAPSWTDFLVPDDRDAGRKAAFTNERPHE
jgi:hypothetical protein